MCYADTAVVTFPLMPHGLVITRDGVEPLLPPAVTWAPTPPLWLVHLHHRVIDVLGHAQAPPLCVGRAGRLSDVQQETLFHSLKPQNLLL